MTDISFGSFAIILSVASLFCLLRDLTALSSVHVSWLWTHLCRVGHERTDCVCSWACLEDDKSYVWSAVSPWKSVQTELLCYLPGINPLHGFPLQRHRQIAEPSSSHRKLFRQLNTGNLTCPESCLLGHVDTRVLIRWSSNTAVGTGQSETIRACRQFYLYRAAVHNNSHLKAF